MKSNKYYHRFKFHIGQRMIKTTVAVYICFIIYQLRGQSEVPFYAAIAAVLSMQTDPQNSGINALERMEGTLIGAVYGILLLFFARLHLVEDGIIFFIMALCMIPVIQTSILIRKGATAAISCVVFLSIAAGYNSNAAILIITRERILDTLLGIVVALVINIIKIPRSPRKNILFVFHIDHPEDKKGIPMSNYCKKELTRMIESGANIAFSTVYSPAVIWQRLSDIQMKLPVIAMNGSVLYDLKECKYVRNYSIPETVSQKLIDILEAGKIGYFVHSVVHDAMLIYVSDFRHMCLQDKYRKLRGTPYRNYIYGHLPKDQKAVTFYILDRVEVIDGLLKLIEQTEIRDEIHLDVVPEKDYPGYKSVSVYSKTALIEDRIKYLMDETGVLQVVTIGSAGRGFDVVIEDGDENSGVKIIRRLYEAFFWEKKKLK